jgi:hypothetical protein
LNYKTVGEPVFIISREVFLHNAKAILTTRRAGGLFVLQSSVFRINEKLLNGEQGHALTNNAPPYPGGAKYNPGPLTGFSSFVFLTAPKIRYLTAARIETAHVR